MASTATLASLSDTTLVWQVLGLFVFTIHDASSWSWWHYIMWAAVIVFAMDLLARIVLGVGNALGLGENGRAIKDSAKRLEQLDDTDFLYIGINKLLTALFTYHVIAYAWHSGHVVWALDALTLANSLAALVALYVIYDLGYCLFHRALHWPPLYPLVHKHHHKQHSPFRGNVDAINVHPFEFVVGEYNHLFAIHAVSLALRRLGLGSGVHLGAVAVFIIMGGVLASLNHTRFDVRAPLVPGVFQVRYHDIHHARNVRRNYSQYTMLWDVVFGTFLAYDESAATLGSSGSSENLAAERGSSTDLPHKSE